MVTSTDGTKRYYGGSDDSVLSGSGGIVHWGLRMVEDVHGNKMNFTYYNEFASGVFFQVKKISYGKNNDYTVNFNKETSITRKDITVNAKQGLPRSDAFLLKNIEVKYKDELIRTYKMDYIDGEFFKTLLKRIYIVPNNPCSTSLAKGTEGNKDIVGSTDNDTGKTRDMDDGSGGSGGTNGGIEPTCNEISDSYTFDYYNDVRDGQGTVKLFGPDTAINVQNDKHAYSGFIRGLVNPSKINGNISSESGTNFRVAAGLNFYVPSNDGYGHLMFGLPFGSSKAKARNAQQLVDFNGDGIQDMIYRVPDEGLFLRTGKLNNSGNLSFNGSLRIENYNGGDFSYTETKTTSRGWDLGVIGYSQSDINSTSHGSTSTYLIDANSDGLMDIVNDGEVWFNRFDSGSGKSEMTRYSEYTENMVVKAKAIQTPIMWCGDIGGDPQPCPVKPEAAPADIEDVVKVWVAPKDGYVRFTDDVSLASPSNNRGVHMYYSVEIKNPVPVVNGSTVTYSNTRIYLQKILGTYGVQNIVINHYNDYYAQMQTVPAEGSIIHGINNPDRLFVKSGDKIYVRLHKNMAIDLPVSSNPTITYVDQNTGADIANTFELSQDQFQLNNGNYGSNFLLNNAAAPILLDAPGTVSVQISSFTFPSLSDEVKFRIITENINTGDIHNLIAPEIYNQTNLTTQAHTLDFDVNANEPVYLRFIVESDSYTNFKTFNWNNRIKVSYNATPDYASSPVTFTYQGIPEYPSFVVTQLKPKLDIHTVPGSASLNSPHDFGVQINKDITNFSTLSTGTFYYIVKKGNKVEAKRRITVSHTNGIIVEKNMINDLTISGISPITFFSGNPSSASSANDHLVTVEVYCKTNGDYTLFNKYSDYFSGKSLFKFYSVIILWQIISPCFQQIP
ncbi:hypothetical protein [uncultured Chryseobacterium sp.]|uniref:hypothetical protein n=1 Tax=uncultured Chryseobacterium sp. TaxID=259322 RepID=UPI0025D0547F|nr:hypothetical protein [uncultured Chryseobacterium sp.]